jgi:conjugative relaxase-like TrwC/TraI family protein
MLRIIPNTSAAGAKTYYPSPSASMAEYYAGEGQELAGVWRGKGAERLGLSGEVGKEAWAALCDNLHPATGKSLTARQKKVRRVGWDFNWHCPKSVSVLYGLTGDQRILDAFRDSVNETMQEIESEFQTRVRKSGKDQDRVTGNAIWGEFIHQTARPIKEIPDPHLHAHTFVFNATFDEAENRWKAAQIGNIKGDGSFWEAKFHSRMALRLSELGVPVERTRKGYEVVGFSPATLRKFSRRRANIEETLRTLEEEAEKKWQEDLRTDPNAKKEVIDRNELGVRTRERKQKDLSMEQLRREWLSRLSGDEADMLTKVREQVGSAAIGIDESAAREAAALAVEHCFERKSVLPERQIITEALKRSYGNASPQAVIDAVADQHLIVGEQDGKRVATTSQVLAEENSMLRYAREGRGQCEPLASGAHVFKREWLNEDQRRAVEHILASKDRVVLIRGGAGTGKTVMMKAAAEAIEAAGTKVFAFAPSADASRGTLRAEGFENAETVAMLLKDEKLQQAVAGQIIYIDEAGLLGTRTTADIFKLADRIGARLILQGDRSQHASVERGSALRLLETEAGLAPAELKVIQRQQGTYRQAVSLLSQGKTKEGFAILDGLGWVKEVPESERYKMLAGEYIAAIKKGKSALVIAPTHREIEQTNDAIRSALRGGKLLGKEQRRFIVLENLNLTVGERRDTVNLMDGDVIEYHQNAKQHKKGARLIVGETPVPPQEAERFTAYHTHSLPVSPKEMIRITKNGTTLEGSRINNGTVLRVAGFTKDGNIRLTNGHTLKKDWGHWTYAYSQTSHSSQGRTCDVVLIADSEKSYPASSREQAYVSVSRGRRKALIFTDSKENLLEAISQSDARTSATEMVAERNHRERAVAIARVNQHGQERFDVTLAEREREIAHER